MTEVHKNQQAMKLVLILVLLTLAQSGPLAIGVWTACMAACSPLAAGGPFGMMAAIACWAACGPAGSLACFAQNTTVISQHGTILLKTVSIGERVLTSNEQGETQWTRVKQLIINQSEHEFVRISTETKEISVTIDHVMIHEQKLLRAKELQVGMKLGNETILQIQFFKENNRITVVTESGTILANQILTTTICGDYLDVEGNQLSVIQKWKKDHECLMQ